MEHEFIQRIYRQLSNMKLALSARPNDFNQEQSQEVIVIGSETDYCRTEVCLQ